MASLRATLISLLSARPPDLEAALTALSEVDEDSLTPGALLLRTAALEAAEWLDNSSMARDEIAAFLREAASAHMPELDDHEIDVDLTEGDHALPGFQGIPGVAFSPRPGSPAMPGPDAKLLEAVVLRDGLVARRIAGDTPSPSDLDAYHAALVALGRALAPLVEAQDHADASGGL